MDTILTTNKTVS